MSSFQLPQPTGLQFPEWSRLVSEAFAAFGVAASNDEVNWKDWASSLLYVPQLVAENIPTPQGFATWQEWGCRLLQSVR